VGEVGEMSPPPRPNPLIYKGNRFLKVAKMPFLRGKIGHLQGLFGHLPAFGEARPYGRRGLGFPIK
jgi:hypothetical protein